MNIDANMCLLKMYIFYQSIQEDYSLGLNRYWY